MDKAGETTVVDGVSGGGGGEAADSFAPEFVTARVWARALSSANTSQNARCVMKLSLLQETQTKLHR